MLLLGLLTAGLVVQENVPAPHRQETPGCEVDTLYFQQRFLPLAEESRRAAARSRELSAAAGRDEIQPAYMLAAILSEESNAAARGLARAGVNVSMLTRDLQAVPGPHAPPDTGPDLAYSRHGVAVWSYAIRHARAHGDSAVTTLSLLMGITQCSGDPAERLLRRAHIDSLKIEQMVVRQRTNGV